MDIAVLGCGPAGLAAAHTAIGLGHKVTVISKVIEQSKLYGCQYLHAPIPGFETVPRVRVSYQLQGTPEEYRLKVYGPDWTGKVSPEDFVGEHDAWDIRETYRRLWWQLFMWEDTPFLRMEMNSGMLEGALGMKDFDRVVSTIPAPFLCRGGHDFRSHRIWANGSQHPIVTEDNIIICDGTAGHDWYRISSVFGHRTIEWPDKPADFPPAVQVTKPLSTDCDCFPEVIRAGRYGEWSKGRLVHQVPALVTEALG